MSEWAELAREDVEEMAAAYALTLDRVRTLADEHFPDNTYEAEQLFQRARQNVQATVLKDLMERGCPPEEVDSWLMSILQEAERLRSDGDPVPT
jgi:hypothetical protein